EQDATGDLKRFKGNPQDLKDYRPGNAHKNEDCKCDCTGIPDDLLLYLLFQVLCQGNVGQCRAQRVDDNDDGRKTQQGETEQVIGHNEKTVLMDNRGSGKKEFFSIRITRIRQSGYMRIVRRV